MQMTEAVDWQLLEQSANNPIWIGDAETLARYCSEWSQLPLIAIDTEFVRTETFYPIPGLIQVGDDSHCYLIDPLSIDEFGPFIELLQNPAVIKVLHSGSEDLELFQNSFGVIPQPLFDTQIAAAFIGWGFSMGLQRLVQHALGIELGKAHTVSDWLKRPLTQEQVHYAALDVAYLAAIAHQQIQLLQEKGRLEWFRQECEALRRNCLDEDPQGKVYYLRFTQMNLTDPERLAGLRDLASWREQVCRSRNLCRARVLRNEVLLEIINRWPTTLEELSAVPDLWRQVVNRDGAEIMEVLANAAESAEQNPPLPISLPVHVYWNSQLKKMLAMGRKIAAEQDIQPEILIRRRDVEKLINSRDEQGRFYLPDSLSGWRKPLVGDLLYEKVCAFDAERTGSEKKL
ncbi:ribonuclease D [Nitrincola alkalilacustris]|uniref:ribonuclease D n=1 Tax=Nitrincola alkalilacustris TaxID=1571224 RepID=UPI001F0F7902|nr:ribonuclease D [Nitrincola alkalilacustris]